MPVTIVCIEDEVEIRELLSAVLDSPKVELRLFPLAVEGLKMVRENPP